MRFPYPFRLLGMACLVAMPLAGCDNDDPLDPGTTDYLAPLVGAWSATSFRYSNNANPAEFFDAIAAGMHMALAIGADGRFAVTFAEDGGVTVDTGTVSATATALTVTPVGDAPMVFEYTLAGNVLTMVNTNQVFDFDDDDVAATLTIVLQRATASPSLSQLAGFWSAQLFRMTELAAPNRQVDIIQAGGFMTIQITAAGVITAVMGMPGSTDIGKEIGTISVSGDSMTITMPGQPAMKLAFTLLGGMLGTSMSPMLFDFDGDGTNEIVRMEQIFTRITQPALSALDGTWVLDGMAFRNPLNPAQSYWVEAGPLPMTTVLDGGTITSYMLEMGRQPNMFQGGLSLFGNLMMLELGEEDGPGAVRFAIDDDELIIWTVAEKFDWNQDGHSELATARMHFNAYTGPGLAELAGTWTAASWLVVDPFAPQNTVDLLAGGGVVTMIMQPDGQTRMIRSVPGDEEYDETTATFSAAGPILSVGLAPYVSYMAFSMDASGIQLINPYDSHPWDGPEEPERESVLYIQLVPVTDVAAAPAFAGQWIAAQMIFHEVGGQGRAEDVIIAGGSLAIDVAADLTYAMTLTDPAQNVVNEAGEFEIFGNILLMYKASEQEWSALKYEFEGQSLRLRGFNDAFDFDGGGQPVPAILELLLSRPPAGQ